MGRLKGLLDFNGRPWLGVQLERVSAAGVKRVVVVLGHGAATYRAACPWAALDRSVAVVDNAAPERGPFSSLVTGLRAARSAAWPGPVFVLPVDVPCPAADVWIALLSALESRGAQAVLPQLGGRGGHPVLLSAAFARGLAGFDDRAPEAYDHPDARLDRRLAALGPAAERVPVSDARVLVNVNTPERWAEFVAAAP